MRGLSEESRLKLKEEFGQQVDTLEVQDSDETWTSITRLGGSVGGFSVTIQIDLKREKPTPT